MKKLVTIIIAIAAFTTVNAQTNKLVNLGKKITPLSDSAKSVETKYIGKNDAKGKIIYIAVIKASNAATTTVSVSIDTKGCCDHKNFETVLPEGYTPISFSEVAGSIKAMVLNQTTGNTHEQEFASLN